MANKHLIVMPRLVQNISDGYSFPLGLPYISAVMKKAGHDVSTINLNHRQGNVQEIIEKEIRNKGINIVSTGGLSFQYNSVREVIEAAKKFNPKIKTIVGGGIITGDPIPAMEALEYADYGVVGEGERTIEELCSALEGNKDLKKVNGLIFKDQREFQLTFPREEIKNLDELPWPDYKGFELDKYLECSPSISGINRKNTVFMIASRSCPYQCTFCFHTVGQKYRQRSLDNFFQELDYLVKEYKVDNITLADELFSVNPERVKEFCSRIKPYNINWWAQFRVDQITKNPEILPLLKESGCSVMSFGLESADNRILRSMKKYTTIEQAEKALKLVYNSGISLEGAFIFGDVEEDWETANNTLRWWKEHSEYKITLNLITIYPGSGLYKHACNKGLIKDRAKFLKENCPQVNVSKLNDKEISLLVREIVEAPMTLTKSLEVVEAKMIDYKSGRMQVKGKCSVCNQDNSWDNVRMFSSSFLACEKCAQRYNLVLTKEFRENINNNVEKILKEYEKIGVWGINYHTADLFRNSRTLNNDKIYAVEISEIKRKMDLYGKRVYSPEIIESEKIPFVIIPIPAYINEITNRIRTNHKGVKKIVDICELVNPNYKQ